MNIPITVTMLVKNAERCLAEALNALASFNEVKTGNAPLPANPNT